MTGGEVKGGAAMLGIGALLLGGAALCLWGMISLFKRK